MKKAFLILLPILTACTQMEWVKPGASALERDQTVVTCRAFGMENFPPVFRPPKPLSQQMEQTVTDCHAYGDNLRCTTGPNELYSSASSISAAREDLNEGSREHAFKTCMRSHGWEYQEIKVEPSKVVLPLLLSSG